MIWNQWTIDFVEEKEYRCGYAASFCTGDIFSHFQPNRNESDISIERTKIGGYKIASHIVADDKMARRPNRRKRKFGDAFVREFTSPEDSPGGAMAGASAIRTSTLPLRVGWIERLAKA
jgi:hypothetical protein